MALLMMRSKIAAARPQAAARPVIALERCRGLRVRAAVAGAEASRHGTSTATVPTPVVTIDNKSDPFATVVTIEFGDRLGELLDTVTSLKNLGLNIVRAKLAGAPGREANTFYVTDAVSSEKILRSGQIEEIRMTIIKNMLYYHPDSAEALATYQAPRPEAGNGPQLGPRPVVPTTVEVRDLPNGSCSILLIETTDRPGLLVDIVRTLHDINVNVVSAEIDTLGRVARDELFVTHAGGPLDGPMAQLAVDALQLYLSLGEAAREKSY